MNYKKLTIALIALFVLLFTSNAAEHPNLFLTAKSVKEIKRSLGKYPVFDQSYKELKAIADQALTEAIQVPFPKDGGGGYTHEKHKNNYYQMNACGMLYQLTGNKKYAQFVLDMLMKYADLYPTIDMHPIERSEVRGKLFWQTLNESVWLVHTANAYDCVYNFLSETDRKHIEKNLFYPIAEFIANGNEANYKVFNKMHNHGTWATSAVGMIAYVMGDKELVNKALYGTLKDGKTGFVKQLDVLFSPDGYFTEGPYYQRYALWPFMTFAQVIENQQPELKIFEHNKGVLKKAVNVLLQLAYNGELFYMNDALEKTYKTQEIVYAVNIAYKNDPTNYQLLDIARQQGAFIVSAEGLATAKALAKKKLVPFQFKSMLLHDGQKGDEGGLAIIRNAEGENQTCFTLKATSHGLSHGHYDKLSISLYDNGKPILTDYGASRFLNIEPKTGGGYTEENHTWAQQTIAHNTVTVDGKSNFNGKIKESSKYHSDILYSNFTNSNLQVISAQENNAYSDIKMHRTAAMIQGIDLEFPIILDVFRVNSTTPHQLDFPFYYTGQMVSTDFTYSKSNAQLLPLGNENGYQHLWLEAKGKSTSSTANFTWVEGKRFYSIVTLTNANTELMLTRLGANDPDFNLRNETAFMLRQPAVTNHTFVSVIEPHGLYDLQREVTSGYASKITTLELLQDNDQYTTVKISLKNESSYLFTTVNSNYDTYKKHSITVKDKKITFTGNYNLTKI